MSDGAPAQPAAATEASPPAVYPPALAHATAPAPRPARLLAAALILHLAVLGGLLALLHAHRLPPAAAPQSIALVLQKAPPAAKPKPSAPPAHAAIPPPPPLPPVGDAAAPPPPRLAGTNAPPPRAAPPRRPPGQPAVSRITTPAKALPGNPPPVVPELAREQGEQGWVLLDVQIGPDGNPEGATIAESSGDRLLDNRARTSVLQHWRFQPATLQGQPIASTIELWVSFSSGT